MKALLKRIKGGLKFTAAFLPLAATLGGTATFIWLACDSTAKLSNSLNEVRTSPVYQEMIESDSAMLKEQLDNKQITMQYYVEKMETLQSDEFLLSYLKIDKEGNKDYIDRINSANVAQTVGIVLSAVYPVVAGIGTFLFFIFDAFSNICYSAKVDFEEALEIKEEEEKSKEIDNYKEEVL